MTHALLAALVLLWAVPSFADDMPWTKDVPQETQDRANELFAEANQLFAQQQHAPAVEKYYAAIALWDHPMIRFNLAVTLIHLKQPLEAAAQLESALRYGELPFKKELYQEALAYKELLDAQLGYVEVSCDRAGPKVMLDGKVWFDCPGTNRMRVLVGEHSLLSEQRGFVPRAQRLFVTGGATARERVALQSLEDAVVYEYPYRRWIPWTVAGGGGAIVVSGVLVWLAGRSQSNDARDRSERLCGSGCTSEQLTAAGLPGEFDSARLKGRIGIATMIGGGAIGAAGVYLLIKNRPHRTIPAVLATPYDIAISWNF